jgi:two-component system, chemotaxis family, chemotaxis protein CheY
LLTAVLLLPQAVARRRLRQALLHGGLERVLEAETAAEALTLLSSQLVSMVLTPWEAPDLAGRALLNALRDRGRNRQLPVVILDDGLAAPQVVAAVKAGAAGRLILPADAQAVRDLLARIGATALPGAPAQDEADAADSPAFAARRAQRRPRR